jgi:hypothetical protein
MLVGPCWSSFSLHPAVGSPTLALVLVLGRCCGAGLAAISQSWKWRTGPRVVFGTGCAMALLRLQPVLALPAELSIRVCWQVPGTVVGSLGVPFSSSSVCWSTTPGKTALFGMECHCVSTGSVWLLCWLCRLALVRRWSAGHCAIVWPGYYCAGRAGVYE